MNHALLLAPMHQENWKHNGCKKLEQNFADHCGMQLGESASGQQQRDGGMPRHRCRGEGAGNAQVGPL